MEVVESDLVCPECGSRAELVRIHEKTYWVHKGGGAWRGEMACKNVWILFDPITEEQFKLNQVVNILG